MDVDVISFSPRAEAYDNAQKAPVATPGSDEMIVKMPSARPETLRLPTWSSAESLRWRGWDGREGRDGGDGTVRMGRTDGRDGMGWDGGDVRRRWDGGGGTKRWEGGDEREGTGPITCRLLSLSEMIFHPCLVREAANGSIISHFPYKL